MNIKEYCEVEGIDYSILEPLVRSRVFNFYEGETLEEICPMLYFAQQESIKKQEKLAEKEKKEAEERAARKKQEEEKAENNFTSALNNMKKNLGVK